MLANESLSRADFAARTHARTRVWRYFAYEYPQTLRAPVFQESRPALVLRCYRRRLTRIKRADVASDNPMLSSDIQTSSL